MTRKNYFYTGSGVELVRRLASEGVRIFTLDQVRDTASEIGLSQGYLRQALHHLTRTGWVVRLRKGLYALSSSVSGGAPLHEFEVATALVEPAAISHWTAMHYHGLTEQPSRKIFILTTTEAAPPQDRSDGSKLKAGNRYIIAGVPYQFIQVKPQRFFGVQKIWVGETRVNITNMERTLLDCLSRPKYCGDFSEVLGAFKTATDILKLERIVDYALRMDAATAKRLGWILESLDISAQSLEPLLAMHSKGYRKLDPTGPGSGRCNKRWRIQENLPGRIFS